MGYVHMEEPPVARESILEGEVDQQLMDMGYYPLGKDGGYIDLYAELRASEEEQLAEWCRRRRAVSPRPVYEILEAADGAAE